MVIRYAALEAGRIGCVPIPGMGYLFFFYGFQRLHRIPFLPQRFNVLLARLSDPAAPEAIRRDHRWAEAGWNQNVRQTNSRHLRDTYSNAAQPGLRANCRAREGFRCWPGACNESE